MTRYVIGIAGPTASGKTSAAKHLEEARGAWRTRYSLILTEIAYQRGLPHDKQTLQHLSTELRSTLGEDFLTKLMRERVIASDASLIVVEGNRRMIDMRFLEAVAHETSRTLILVYIDADPDTRFSRINGRLVGHGERPLTREAFDALENDECEAELPLVRAHITEHGAIIDNSTLTYEELRARVDALIGNLQ